MHSRAEKLFPAWIFLGFGGLLTALFASTLHRGLWEDGYFVKRFAHNFWHHGSFSWNPSDGPVYGMTSQTLQLLGALIYALDPRHFVTILRAVLCAALLATLFTIGRLSRRQGSWPLGLIPAAAGLSIPLSLELAASGLETALALWLVALSIHAVIAFVDRQVGPWTLTLAAVLLYWTRPDAILIPLTLLAVVGSADPRRTLRVAGLIALGLALSCAGFYLYYGTALPLPFYIKTQGISVQSAAHLAIFAPEKSKNALQAGFFALPFVYVALHERTRLQFGLIGCGLTLAAYHYCATVETMGHLSRFYLPALVPLWVAAALAYPAFLRGRRVGITCLALAVYLLVFAALTRLDAIHRIDLMLEPARFYPYLVACAVMLLTPSARPWFGALLLGATLWSAAMVGYPMNGLTIEDDKTILLRQIAPRRVFRGLARLRERVPVRALFHTDMGAPGMLFPEARVVDLDGLLNEAITLRGARFEDLCGADRPEAIFVPNDSYPELRREVLEGSCFTRYRTLDDDPTSPLRIREDLRARYLGN